MNQNIVIVKIDGPTDEEIRQKFARTIITLSPYSTAIMMDKLESIIEDKIGCTDVTVIDCMRFFLNSLSINEQKDILDSCVLKDESPITVPTLSDVEFTRPYKLPGLYDYGYVGSKREGIKKKRRYK